MDLKTRKTDKQELVQQITQAGGKLMPDGKRVHCFLHDDRNPSSSIFRTPDGTYLWRCFVCDKTMDVWALEALNTGLDVRELLHRNGLVRPPPQQFYPTLEALIASIDALAIEEINPYTDPDTKLAEFYTIRYIPRDGKRRKAMTQVVWTKDGFKRGTLGGVMPLFNRIRLNTAQPDDWIFFVEGEKCVRALTKLGLIATTNPGGSSNIRHCDLSPLAGRKVVIIPDNDKPGWSLAHQVKEKLLQLQPKTAVRIVDVTELEWGDGADIADALDELEFREATKSDALNFVLSLAEDADDQDTLSDFEAFLDDMRTGKYINIPVPGFPLLTNECRALLNGRLTVLYGNAGFGKTLFTSRTADMLSLLGHRVIRLEFEDEKELHLLRSMAQLQERSEVAAPDWHKNNPELSRQVYEETRPVLERLTASIECADAAAWNIKTIVAWIEERAAQGYELIIIDPVSVIFTEKIWLDSHNLVWELKRVLSRYKDTRVLLVTHNNADGQVAGGQAFKRFAHSVLFLAKFDQTKTLTVINSDGEEVQAEANGVLQIVKARFGPGTGDQIGVMLEPNTMIMREVGVIVKREDEVAASKRAARGKDVMAGLQQEINI